MQSGVDLGPQVLQATIDLTGETSKIFRITVVATNNEGSITSGIGTFLLADVPDTPDAPVNEASITSDS